METRRDLYKSVAVLNISECDGALSERANAELVSRLSPSQLFAKRAIDLTLSIAVLPACIIIGLFVAIVIKLDSNGPVLFKQVRTGKNGKEFFMYKFRSMYVGADSMLKDLAHLNEATGPVFKIKSDPRVTRVGRWLRRSSIDELPQLINVITGAMSLVGPRPALPSEVAKYSRHQLGRLAVKPGITCIWQVNGRCNVSFDRWIEMDLEYIQNQSVWGDIKILLETIPVVVKGSGAW